VSPVNVTWRDSTPKRGDRLAINHAGRREWSERTPPLVDSCSTGRGLPEKLVRRRLLLTSLSETSHTAVRFLRYWNIAWCEMKEKLAHAHVTDWSTNLFVEFRTVSGANFENMHTPCHDGTRGWSNRRISRHLWLHRTGQWGPTVIETEPYTSLRGDNSWRQRTDRLRWPFSVTLLVKFRAYTRYTQPMHSYYAPIDARSRLNTRKFN